ncbi:MAG TPA: hypothetical protein VF582_00630 [Allosphingosinicella sp.]|jgi:hypothetical protein
MKSLPILLAAIALAGCGSEAEEQRPAETSQVTPEPSGPPVVQQAQPEQKGAQLGVEVESAGGGLRIENPDGTLRMSVVCSGSKLVATVPSFTPIGSEDRFALAIGQEPVTLVADPTRQKAGTGVRAEGPVPDDFEALLSAADQVGALYGTQKIGPHALTKGAASRLSRECSKA